MVEEIFEGLFRIIFRFVVEVVFDVVLRFVLFRPMGAVYFSWLYLSGHGAGWRKLARRFPDAKSPAKLIVEEANGKIGKAEFDHRLEFQALEAGLRVDGMGLLGLMTRPFMVPWAEIVEGGKSKRKGDPRVTLHLGQAGALIIERKLWRELTKARDGAWRHGDDA